MVLTTHRPHVQPRILPPDSAPTLRSPLGPRPRSAVAPTQAPRTPTGAAPVGTPAPTYAKPGLTEREITVLEAWLDCDSKTDVAARLHIALGTVNTHLTRIRGKYTRVGRPAPTKAALVARALQDGIVTLDDL